MRINVSGTTAFYLAQAIVDWINKMDGTIDAAGIKFFASDYYDDSERLVEIKNKIVYELMANSYNEFVSWEWYLTNREKGLS